MALFCCFSSLTPDLSTRLAQARHTMHAFPNLTASPQKGLGARPAVLSSPSTWELPPPPAPQLSLLSLVCCPESGPAEVTSVLL